jgi:hypothetical protein
MTVGQDAHEPGVVSKPVAALGALVNDFGGKHFCALYALATLLCLVQGHGRLMVGILHVIWQHLAQPCTGRRMMVHGEMKWWKWMGFFGEGPDPRWQAFLSSFLRFQAPRPTTSNTQACGGHALVCGPGLTRQPNNACLGPALWAPDCMGGSDLSSTGSSVICSTFCVL